MNSTIARLNQSSIAVDSDGIRTVQAASRSDWQPNEQLVLVTIPDISSSLPNRSAARQVGSAPYSTQVDTLGSDSSGLSHSDRTTKHSEDSSKATNSSQAKSIPLAGEQSEPTREWMTQPPAKPRSEPRPTSAPSPVRSEGTVSAPTSSAFVESIVTRFSMSSSFVLHFCDSELSSRGAETCLSASMELADRMQRRVVMLDASQGDRKLSHLLGAEMAAGLREVVRAELNWRELARPTSHPMVTLLPSGVVRIPGPTANGQLEIKLRKLFAELKSEFGIVCVCTDTAFDDGVPLVSPCCDGTFLTFDYQRTSRGLTRTAAAQLRDAGARLMGCIAMPSNKA